MKTKDKYFNNLLITNLMIKKLLSLMLLLCALITGSGSAWAEEVVHYTLDGTVTATGNAYATATNLTQNNIGWSVVGNTEQNPWRIGGKSLTNVDREIKSTTAMTSAITKVEVSVGSTGSSLTVNSIKLVVASDADFNTVLDESTKTSNLTSTTLTFTPTSGTEWATGAYYKIVFNVTRTSSSGNGYVQFNNAKFYKESGSSGPVQLDAPELTANANNGSVTLEWDEISNASSYTIQYADNASFTGATTVDDATSPQEISGLTNGTTYYFKAMTVGDETNYLSSDYGDAVSATPANVSKITITQNELTDFSNSYGWYDWTAGDVSGSAYAYKNSGMQFNSGKDGYWIYNTSAIPGTITSVKMVKASGTDRSWTLKAGTSVISTTDGGTLIGSAQTVGTSGATWNVEGSYKYFCLIVSGGSTVISSIEITYIPSTDPAISASDVDITYDATSGSIAYTLENATGNVSATVTTGSDWLTLGTITSSSVPFTCSANTGAERTATVTLSFSGADDKVVTVTQAAMPPHYTTISGLFTGATSTATDVLVTFDDWVVSAVSTYNVYVTDGTNGFIINIPSGTSDYAVGNILSGTAVSCSLKLNYGYAQLTGVSGLTVTTGGTVSTANIAMASLAGVNTGALVSYNNLTCTVNGGTYTLTDGTTTIQLYKTLYDYTTTPDLLNGHKYNITGIYQQYNTTKEVLPRSSADIVEVSTPAISVSPASLSGFTYEVDNGPSTTKTISVSGSNLTADITLSLGNNSDFEMSTNEGSGYTNSLTLTQSAGAVASTTIYVRLKADLSVGNSYSGTITLTSTDATDVSVSLSGSVTEPVVDYATLPFAYDSDAKTGNLVDGLTSNGISGNYATSPKIKFDTTDDYVILKLNEAPSCLSFDIKGMGSGTWSGTFDVLTSTDGVDYSTTLQQYTSLSTSAVSSEVFALASTVRYIKWVFTSKTSGFNVALGNIRVNYEKVTVTEAGYATYASANNLDFTGVDGITANTAKANGATVTLTPVNKVPADAGIVLEGTAGTYYIPVTTESVNELTDNELVGVTTDTQVDETTGTKTNYILSNETSGIGFYKASGAKLSANRAYLSTTAANGVKEFLSFCETDGIRSIDNGQLTTDNDVIYNMAGQRIARPTRGLYIVNGRKVLVK